MKIHYGTPNGPACGAHFRHEGITLRYDRIYVTCWLCKATVAFKNDAVEADRAALAEYRVAREEGRA
jgi:hypothetical protein